MSRACRTRCVECVEPCVEPCCSTGSTQPTCMAQHVERVESCRKRDEPSGIWASNLQLFKSLISLDTGTFCCDCQVIIGH